MMNDQRYTPYHPRWYRPRISTWWWLKRRSSLTFILRELSSIFVVWFVIFFLMLVRAVSGGEIAYQRFIAWSANPVVLVLNVISFFFVVFHAITWFNLAPQAMVVRVRGKRVPGLVIALSNYVLWLGASVVIVWLLVGIR